MNIKLRDNETLRQALSRLRKEVKAGETTLEIDEVKDVVEALSSEDPKTRKNAALLLADLANLDVLSDFFRERAREILDTLVSTYVKEDTLFVRSSILEGVKAYLDETKFDISKSVESIISKLEERLSEIDGEEHEESELKHLREERHILTLLLNAGDAKHEVKNLIKPFEVLLTCDKGFAENIADQIVGDAKVTPVGVRSRISRINDLKKIRLYRDLLFLVPIRKGYICDSESLGSLPENSKIVGLLEDLFEAPGDNFKFRIDLKSKDELLQTGKYIRKISAEIEKSSKGRLINDPGDYEVVIVLREKKDGHFSVFINIPKFSDERFAYRQFAEPTSMSPVTAATVVSEIQEYLKPESWIIDPFCGTGTLLLERALFMPSREYYGIDTYGQAIKEARVNAENAGVDVHFINRDYFDFKSDYPFHEILAEFPDFYGKDPKEKDDFYKSFFQKSIEIAASKAMMFVVSSEENLVKKYIRLNSELKFIRSKDLKHDIKIYIIGVEK